MNVREELFAVRYIGSLGEIVVDRGREVGGDVLSSGSRLTIRAIGTPFDSNVRWVPHPTRFEIFLADSVGVASRSLPSVSMMLQMRGRLVLAKFAKLDWKGDWEPEPLRHSFGLKLRKPFVYRPNADVFKIGIAEYLEFVVS